MELRKVSCAYVHNKMKVQDLLISQVITEQMHDCSSYDLSNEHILHLHLLLRTHAELSSLSSFFSGWVKNGSIQNILLPLFFHGWAQNIIFIALSTQREKEKSKLINFPLHCCGALLSLTGVNE